MAPNVGSTISLQATVLHTVDLGGAERNYCLELPSGHTAWLLGSQLGFEQEPADEQPADAEVKAQPGPPATKAVPRPPATKTRKRR